MLHGGKMNPDFCGKWIWPLINRSIKFIQFYRSRINNKLADFINEHTFLECCRLGVLEGNDDDWLLLVGDKMSPKEGTNVCPTGATIFFRKE